MKKEHEILFDPIKVGKLTLNSRFVVAPMSSRTAGKDNKYFDYGNTYFAERVKGGFGIVITEFIAVSPNGLGNVIEPGIWDDSFIESLSKLTAECHKYDGGYIFAQLHHAGATAVSVNGSMLYGPSDRYDNDGNLTAMGMTNQQVYETIDNFVNGAIRAKKAGFDGIEIHGAHMYLLYQFLSNGFNKRTDEFGGSYENRFRIIDLIIKGIKEKCGEDYPVGLRINSSNMEPEGNTIDDYCVFAKMAETSGADYIHMSHPYVLQSYYAPVAYNRENSRKLKEVVNIPVILVGRINDEDLAADIIRCGDADMIALGRQSVADPHFPNKIRNGEYDLIYHCMACGQRCHNSSPGCEEEDQGISCMINPFSGKENRWQIKPSKEKQKYAIIGAGPAGLQAAWILSCRGNEVTVYDKSSEVGGNFITASKTPSKDVLRRAINTIYAYCKKYSVKFQLGKEIKPTDVSSLDADRIIIATGARPTMPNIKGLQEYCVTAEDVINNKVNCGENVAILGGASVALETAELLVSQGKKVDIIYRGESNGLGKGMIRIVKGQLLTTLKDHVKYKLNTNVIEVLDSHSMVIEIDGQQGKLEGYDNIIVALGYKDDESFAQLTDNKKVFVIGDAKQARDCKYAIYEGSKIALNL